METSYLDAEIRFGSNSYDHVDILSSMARPSIVHRHLPPVRRRRPAEYHQCMDKVYGGERIFSPAVGRILITGRAL